MDSVITPVSLDYSQILEMLPHRYPFLLVDRITECVPAQYSKGYKKLKLPVAGVTIPDSDLSQLQLTITNI